MCSPPPKDQVFSQKCEKTGCWKRPFILCKIFSPAVEWFLEKKLVLEKASFFRGTVFFAVGCERSAVVGIIAFVLKQSIDSLHNLKIAEARGHFVLPGRGHQVFLII